MEQFKAYIEGENWKKTSNYIQPKKRHSKWLWLANPKNYTFVTLVALIIIISSILGALMVKPIPNERGYIGLIRGENTLDTEKFGTYGKFSKVNDDYSIEIIDSGKPLNIKFADIKITNSSAKDFLNILLLNEIIYLDICDYCMQDNIYAIAYIVSNGKAINVNYLLVQSGYAEIVDADNDFNPQTWVISEDFIGVE